MSARDWGDPYDWHQKKKKKAELGSRMVELVSRCKLNWAAAAHWPNSDKAKSSQWFKLHALYVGIHFAHNKKRPKVRIGKTPGWWQMAWLFRKRPEVEMLDEWGKGGLWKRPVNGVVGMGTKCIWITWCVHLVMYHHVDKLIMSIEYTSITQNATQNLSLIELQMLFGHKLHIMHFELAAGSLIGRTYESENSAWK